MKACSVPSKKEWAMSSGLAGGTISAAHVQREMEQTVNAFRESLRMLKREGEF